MKYALIAGLLFTNLPHIVLAQDGYDTGPTDRCLSAATSLADKRDCVGQAAEGCADLSLGGFNTRSMTACLGHELAYFDDMLNVEYARVRDLAREMDQSPSGASLDDVSMEDLLVQMQRAWITYRDATCAYEQRQMDGGTIGQLFYAECMADLTAEQTFRLQSTVLGL